MNKNKIIILIIGVWLFLPQISFGENAKQINFTVQNGGIIPITWQDGEMTGYPSSDFGNSYLSVENIVGSSGGFCRIDTNIPGTIISNIYDPGEFRVQSISSNDNNLGYNTEGDPNNTGGCVNDLYVRSGNSTSEIESASWFRVSGRSPYGNIYANRYVQWKAVLKDTCSSNNNRFIIFQGLYSKMWGQIVDSATNEPIADATVRIGTTVTKAFRSDNSSYGYMTGIVPNTEGWYEISNYYKTTGNVIEVSADGYNTYSENLNYGSSSEFFNSSDLRKNIKLTRSGKSSITRSNKPSSPLSSKPQPQIFLSKITRIQNGDIETEIYSPSTITLFVNQKLSLSGTTSPNAKITFTIKSDPINKEVIADNNGSWGYTIDPQELALDVGGHTISAVVVDADNIVSDPIEIAAFTINENSPQTNVDYKFKMADLFTPINYLLGGLVILLIAGLVYVIIKQKNLTLELILNKIRRSNP